MIEKFQPRRVLFKSAVGLLLLNCYQNVYNRCIRLGGEYSDSWAPDPSSMSWVPSSPIYLNVSRRLHGHFVLVPADKTINNVNIVFVCKGYYYRCLLNELRFTCISGNPTCIRSNLRKDEILQNRLSVSNTFNHSISLNYSGLRI
jgi:hypothetical protein